MALLDPRNPAFWQQENSLLVSTLDELILDILLRGGQSGLDLMPTGFDLLIDWDVFNANAIAFLRQYQLDTINGINETTRARVVQEIERWVREGAELEVLKARLRPLFTENRADAIAITEVTRIYAQGNMLAWQATGMVSGKRWSTARDERVCFPAYTQVLTERGERAIQDIKVGGMVLTRRGYKRVKVVSKRLYSGPMTTIQANGRELTATSDHPVWHSQKAWLPIRDFKVGDGVYAFDDQISKVGSVVNFNIGNSNNMPASLVQVPSLSSVPTGVLVPVGAVNFKGNTIIGQGKVNGIAPHSGLLHVRNGQIVKTQPYELFKTGFTLKSPVTGKRTEDAFVAGRVSKALAAIAARRMFRWPSALLRAVMSIEPLFGRKRFPAPLAINILGIGGAAVSTTDGVSVSNGSLDLKGLATFRTKLNHHIGGAVSLVAGAGTKLSTLFNMAGQKVKTLTANGAINVFSRSFSFGLSKSNLFIGGWHGSQLLTNIGILYHRLLSKPIYVYDLEIEEAHEFFANGVLVHNCPICGPLHGQIVSLSSNFTLSPDELAESPQFRRTMGDASTADRRAAASRLLGNTDLGLAPPAHPRCRCWLQPFVSTDAVRDQRLADLGLLDAFHAAVDSGVIAYER